MSETDLREYADEIQTLTGRFPEDRSLRLDYRELQAFDADLAVSSSRSKPAAA